MSALLERIEAHFRPDETRKIDVPEWGEAGKPLVVHFKPVTIEDLEFAEQVAKGSQRSLAANIVALKASDAEGKRLFQQIDVVALKTKADPLLVQRLYLFMVGALTAEQAEKN